jgi:hypothetical protein
METVTDKIETRTVKTSDNENESDLALFRLFLKNTVFNQ